MTPQLLEWREDGGVCKSSAHGFTFTVRDETLQVHVASTFLSQFYGCPADARRKAQEISDAVSAVIVAAVREAKEETLMVAKLASDKAEFYNPRTVWDAKALRDRILADSPQIGEG